MPEKSTLAYNHSQIQDKTVVLARTIYNDIRVSFGPDIEITFIVLLKGGARFAFDLMNNFPADYYYDFIGVSSYQDSTCPGDSIDFFYYRLEKELIDNKAVVLLDDISDSGRTFISALGKIRNDFKPKAIKTCALILREKSEFKPDYYGFITSSDSFLIGYGLGVGEKYRHLNDILETG
jgi:hypoxanthine phosphoribosyltransferase